MFVTDIAFLQYPINILTSSLLSIPFYLERQLFEEGRRDQWVAVQFFFSIQKIEAHMKNTLKLKTGKS
jgi:hypothetical protein